MIRVNTSERLEGERSLGKVDDYRRQVAAAVDEALNLDVCALRCGSKDPESMWRPSADCAGLLRKPNLILHRVISDRDCAIFVVVVPVPTQQNVALSHGTRQPHDFVNQIDVRQIVPGWLRQDRETVFADDVEHI